jgi:hypothetical protein
MSPYVALAGALLLLPSLWAYFGFVYFDLEEFKPPSRLKRGWSVILSVALPFFAGGAGPGLSEESRHILYGVAVTTIIVPAIFPEFGPRSSSLREWLYFRTLGQWFVDLVESGVLYGIAFMASAMGSFWLALYCGLAMVCAVGRSMWVRVQPDASPHTAKPTLQWILIVAPVVAMWVWLIVAMANFSAHNWNKDLADFYKTPLITVLWSWALGRWPWLVRFHSATGQG